jgi:hypothetical protein
LSPLNYYRVSNKTLLVFFLSIVCGGGSATYLYLHNSFFKVIIFIFHRLIIIKGKSDFSIVKFRLFSKVYGQNDHMHGKMII